ncbi:hypothetical protein [Chryseobacterium sp.]|uniref:hypothetical protein n=1 Tax=Chryseobacterium sp. TaxID=1871047 RepID=UPI00321BBBBE
MKKVLLMVTLCILASCTNEKKNENPQVTNEIQPINANLEKLKIEASRLRGGGSISNIALENEKAIISYVKNYTEYKQLNPQSKLTKDDLNAYWSTGDAIQKALIEGSVRILKESSFINEIEIILPFENNVYKIDVKKTELEQFIGKSLSQIKNNWTKTFIDPYVYDKKGRESFFNKFGTKN